MNLVCGSKKSKCTKTVPFYACKLKHRYGSGGGNSVIVTSLEGRAKNGKIRSNDKHIPYLKTAE